MLLDYNLSNSYTTKLLVYFLLKSLSYLLFDFL